MQLKWTIECTSSDKHYSTDLYQKHLYTEMHLSSVHKGKDKPHLRL